MSHQLLLMRHAKSGHDDPALSDHDRPLAPRGRRNATEMAQWLIDQDLVPDLILCSSSHRTRETAEQLLCHWDKKPVVVSSPDLYLSSPATMLDVLIQDNRGAKTVMILAHNPGVSTLASMLARRSINMDTSAIAA